MICFNPEFNRNFLDQSQKQARGSCFPLPGPRARTGCARWCFSVKASLFGLCAQKAFALQLSEFQGCRPSLKLTTASGTFQEGLKTLVCPSHPSQPPPEQLRSCPSLSPACQEPGTALSSTLEGTLHEQGWDWMTPSRPFQPHPSHDSMTETLEPRQQLRGASSEAPPAPTLPRAPHHSQNHPFPCKT